MGRTKDFYMVVDTETTAHRLVYDVGAVITDRKGTIHETFSAIAAEVFFGMPDEMKTAYYKEKKPLYYTKIGKLQTQVLSFFDIQEKLIQLMNKYNIKAVCAYNAKFDIDVLNNTIRYLTGYQTQYFFPQDTLVYCIWGMACETLCKQKAYIKYSIENGFITSAGNMKTDAESMYRYIIQDRTFNEEHMALEDTYIETVILAKCFLKHKRMSRKILIHPWKIPQGKYKTVLNAMSNKVVIKV